MSLHYESSSTASECAQKREKMTHWTTFEVTMPDIPPNSPSNYEYTWDHPNDILEIGRILPTDPVNEKRIEQSFRRCTQGLTEAAKAERIFLIGDKNSVDSVRRAIRTLDTAIDIEQANLQAFNRLEDRHQRDPTFQTFFRELPAKIIEMQLRRDQLAALVNEKNVNDLPAVIDAKHTINGFLDDARAEPNRAGECVCLAQDAVDQLRKRIPPDSPLHGEIDQIEARIDARTSTLKLTEAHVNARLAVLGWNGEKKKMATLAKEALFIMMAQHRLSLNREMIHPSEVPREITNLGTELHSALTSVQQDVYQKFLFTCKNQRGGRSTHVFEGAFRPTIVKSELMPAIDKVKVSRQTRKQHQINISLIEYMKFWKPSQARIIAEQLNDVSHRALKMSQFMDQEIHAISKKNSDQGQVPGITNTQYQISNLRAELMHLELQMRDAESNPSLGKSDLVGEIRKQIEDIKVQIEGLEAKRAAMVAAYPFEVRAIIQKRDQIADLTQTSWFDSQARRLANLAKAVQLAQEINILRANLDPKSGGIAKQERFAATVIIQNAYAQEYREVRQFVNADNSLTAALNAPVPKQPSHWQLAGYVRRALLQIAVPDRLKPIEARLDAAQRTEILRNLERVRAVIGEAAWDELLEDPSLAPFKTEYTRLNDDPIAHAFEQARYGLMKLASGPPKATLDSLDVLYHVHSQITQLTALEAEQPSFELADQIATFRIQFDLQSQRLLDLKDDSANIASWTAMPLSGVTLKDPKKAEYELVLGKVLANAMLGVNKRTPSYVVQQEKILSILWSNPIRDEAVKAALTRYQASKVTRGQAETNQPLEELLKYQRNWLIKLQQINELFGDPEFQSLIPPESKDLFDAFTTLLKENLSLSHKLQAEFDTLLAMPLTAVEMAQYLEKTTLNSQEYRDVMLKMAPLCLDVYQVFTPGFYERLNKWRASLKPDGRSGNIRLLFNGDPIGDSQLAIQAVVAQQPTRIKLILAEMVKLNKNNDPIFFSHVDESALESPSRLLATYTAQSEALNQRTRQVEITRFSTIIIKRLPPENQDFKDSFLQALMSDDPVEHKNKLFDGAEFYFEDMADATALLALEKLRIAIDLPPSKSPQRLLRDLRKIIPLWQYGLYKMVDKHIKGMAADPERLPDITTEELVKLENYFANGQGIGKSHVAELRLKLNR